MGLDWDKRPKCWVCLSPHVVGKDKEGYVCKYHKKKPEMNKVGKYSGKSNQGIKGEKWVLG